MQNAVEKTNRKSPRNAYDRAMAALLGTLPGLLNQVPLPQAHNVLVAFSGGADSSLLLHTVCDAAPALGLSVCAAHVNHGIRGEEALRDQSFCADTAASLDVPFFTVNLDVPALAAASGEGCEACARSARYAFLEATARAQNCGVILTAHNADDELETMLFRLARGTAASGLCGIPAVRPLHRDNALYVVRPMLDLSKRDVLAACADGGIPYVTDSTNNTLDYARNRIRHNIVPELEALFDKPQAAVRRLCQALAVDEDYIRAGADALWQACHDNPAAGERVILAAPLRQAHSALRRRVLTRWFTENGLDPEAKHLAAAEALLAGEKGPLCTSLPGDMTLCLRNRSRWLCLVPTHPEA